jgi:hypothetical protein
MLVIVLATAATGFLASALLLYLGFRVIWSRYVLAVVIAYGAFLLFVRLWLWLSKDDIESDLEPPDVLDATDLAVEAADLLPVEGPDASGVLEADPDGCLFGIVLLVVALLVGAAGYVVATAPVFFAEVLLDGVLAVGLYRRVKKLHRRHWLSSALRHTWLPFAAAAVLLGGVGAAMSHYSPGADSIGDVWMGERSR